VIVGGSTEEGLDVLVELVVLGEITDVGGEIVRGFASIEEVLVMLVDLMVVGAMTEVGREIVGRFTSTEEVSVVLVELLMLGEIIEKVLVVLGEPVLPMVLVVFGGRSGIDTEASVGAGIVPHSASEA
jgi:hypothetical protein